MAVTDERQGAAPLRSRGQIVSQLVANPGLRYVMDWDAVYIERNRQLDLKNPFHTYDKEAARLLRGLS